jgi:general secretion pathway protein D
MAKPIEDEAEIFDQAHPAEQKIVIPEILNQEVSLALNENLTIRSVLCETAKKLNIDFQIDSTINSKIIFRANKKKFIEVLDAICDIANLRYTIRDKFVRVMKDEPYTETYSIQFLNFSRDSENKISIATEVSSPPSEISEKGGHGSSDSTVTVVAKSDFWSELDTGIKIIIGNRADEVASYSVNRQSGIITVHANSKIHRQIKNYIEKVKEATMSQVLIEAKIVEVVLKNEYRRGIDWDLVSKRSKIKADFGTISIGGLSNQLSHGTPVTLSYKTGGSEHGLPSILKALEEFGSTRMISNPRLTAMNNQAAILKVAQNYVYFKLNYDKTYSTSDSRREDVTVSSDIKTVPIGFVMFVQPSIDAENDTVTLFLRPTITKLASSVHDPAVDIAIRSIDSDNKSDYKPSEVPVTEVREVTSVLKLNDGEIAVLGGFMEVRSSKLKAGIPIIQDIPGAGEIVSSYGTGDDIVELVILIRVKIIKKRKHLPAADIRLQRFVPDPRPF